MRPRFFEEAFTKFGKCAQTLPRGPPSALPVPMPPKRRASSNRTCGCLASDGIAITDLFAFGGSDFGCDGCTNCVQVEEIYDRHDVVLVDQLSRSSNIFLRRLSHEIRLAGFHERLFFAKARVAKRSCRSVELLVTQEFVKSYCVATAKRIKDLLNARSVYVEHPTLVDLLSAVGGPALGYLLAIGEADAKNLGDVCDATIAGISAPSSAYAPSGRLVEPFAYQDACDAFMQRGDLEGIREVIDVIDADWIKRASENGVRHPLANRLRPRNLLDEAEKCLQES